MTESNGCLKELKNYVNWKIRKKLKTNETEDNKKYCKTQMKNDFRISRDA